MKKNLKTFPNNKIFILLLTILLICCNSESKIIIKSEQFINIYAQLLIINELKIKNVNKESFTNDLLKRNNVSKEYLNLALDSYKQNPEEWVSILQKVRDRMRELKMDEFFLQSGYSGAVNQTNKQTGDHQDSP
jgi:hypothetical protein